MPGVLYGTGEPVAIAVAERELRRALTGAGGLHSILDVEIDGVGKTHPSILKDYQLDNVRGGVTHVDLQEVRLDRPITASVAVTLLGGENSPGVREGGVLSQPLRELSIEALPLEIPEHLDLDVSALAIGDALRVADLTVPDGVKVLDEPETRVASVTAPTRVVEEVPEAEEGAEGAEGEAAEGRRRGCRRAGSGRRLLLRRGLAHAALAAASGLVARPARRGARQPGPRVRAQPPQRRRHGRRRAGATLRRLLALEVLRAARRDPARGPQARAAEAGDVHERVRPLGRRGCAVLQGRARLGARRPRRRRTSRRDGCRCGSAAASPATTACARSRST